MSVAEAAAPVGLRSWLRAQVPTREGIAANRWLRPVAHRLLAPALWRFTRRSVPRGVALGLLAGTLLPVAHVPLAAVLAVPLRANVPVAVATSLLNNPLTIGPLFWAAYRIGRWLLRPEAAPVVAAAGGQPVLVHWLVAGGPPIALGLLVLAAVLATSGYVATSLVWRARLARRWRNRRHRLGN